MSSDSADELIPEMDIDDWSDVEDDEQEVRLVKDLDSRRLVENKLEDLRLQRELNDYSFDF